MSAGPTDARSSAISLFVHNPQMPAAVFQKRR